MAVLSLVAFLTGAMLLGRPLARLQGGILPVARSQHDLELMELIPLLVGALAFRDGPQDLQAAAGIGGLLIFIGHVGIIHSIETM